MQGYIKTYLPEKHYGFIKGDDNKDYFFHERWFINKNDIPRLAEEARIEFEQFASPKGYQARKCRLLDNSSEIKYILPNTILTSRDNVIKGWEIKALGTWKVIGADRSPNNAKIFLIANAVKTGANAILNVQYHKTTEAEASNNGNGTHYYTMHWFSGQIAFVAKKNINGTWSEENTPDINHKAEIHFAEILRAEEERANNHKRRKRNWILLVLIAPILGFIINEDFGATVLFISIFASFFFFIINRLNHPYRWLKKIQDQKFTEQGRSR